MLPSNWAGPETGPRRFDLASEGMRLRERYRPLGQSPQLDQVFEVALGAGATQVYLDRPYVDFDYRSDLAHFYARAFRPPPPDTERLLFADEEKIIGASVVRPLPQQVGRTHLPPPENLKPYVTCTTEMGLHAFGAPWTTTGYPFTSQDGEYGVCAHAAMWSIARYHHLEFGTERYTTSGIIEAAGLRERPDKTARSAGLYAQDIVRGFRGIGLPALEYDVETIPSEFRRETPHTIIHRYLNSGIPVGVLTSVHMLVLIGYGVDSADEPFYIVSDDRCGAYECAPLNDAPDDDNAWKMLVIPQPGRIHVSGEAAEARAEEAFEDRIRADTGPSHLFQMWQEGNLETRTYATPSSTYIERVAARGMPDELRQHHIYAPKGNWLWITEFQEPKAADDQLVIGEVVVDATSLHLDPSPIFANIEGWAYVWEMGAREPRVIDTGTGARFESAMSDPGEREASPAPKYAPCSGDPVE